MRRRAARDGWEGSDCVKQLGPALFLTFWAMVLNLRAVARYVRSGEPM